MSKEKRNTVKKTVTMHPNCEERVRNFSKKITIEELAKESGLLYKKYKVLVWFRYVANGEQEKDFDTFTVNALSVEHAKLRVTEDHFLSKTEIPFKFEVNQINQIAQ